MPDYPTGSDPVALFQSLINATWFGIPVDKDAPPGMGVTMEMVEGEAVLTSPVLKGDKGDKGDNAPIVDLQWPAKASAAELPAGLGPADAGKAWWVGTPTPNVVYIWTGDDYAAVHTGPPGPVGPMPNVTPTVRVIPLDERDEDTVSTVEVTGSGVNRTWHMELLAPEGPVGPSTTITGAPDYDDTEPPTDGQTLVWSTAESKWQPSDYTAKHPRHYSIPEAAFSSFTGPAQRHTIASIDIPAQDFAWTPFVTGHLRASGLELDADPLTIGCEVRLGDPLAGQVVGRGWGNVANVATITPHFTTTGNTAVAVAPDNGVATIAAGVQGKISVNLYNDGLFGTYVFNPAGAQLSILLIPQG